MKLRTAARLLSDPACDWRAWGRALSRVARVAYVEPPFTVPRVLSAVRANAARR